jgi:hypothetical protein
MKVINKKGFLIRDFVAVGLIFGIIVALYIVAVGSIANNYNNQDIISPSFSAHYNHLADNLAKLDVSNKAVQGSGGLSLIGAFNIAFNSVFTVIAMVWDSVTIYTGMASSMVSDFSFLDGGTLTLFLRGCIAILVVYLIFIWLSSVTRGKL